MELGTQEALIETSGRGGDWPWALGSSQMAMLAGGVTEHALDCIELAWPPMQEDIPSWERRVGWRWRVQPWPIHPP